MKLTDLEPELLRVTATGEYKPVDMLHEASGIAFTCPTCDGILSHRVYLWFADRGAPESAEGEPRWGVTGLDIATLSLTADVRMNCAHFWIRDGEVS